MEGDAAARPTVSARNLLLALEEDAGVYEFFLRHNWSLLQPLLARAHAGSADFGGLPALVAARVYTIIAYARRRSSQVRETQVCGGWCC